ncbi:MAG: hypothetical protein ABI321_01385 [Polyangia bacterium]
MKSTLRLASTTLLLLAMGCHHSKSSGDLGVDTDAGIYDDMGAFNLDAFLSEHDGMLPDGFIVPPPPDGGIIVSLPDGGTGICYITPCQGHLYACGDCIDNDGDGLTDSYDPDCLGACQNNEAGFYGSIPGQNNAPCKSDCYWDQDTGSGNDDCHWSHSCDPMEQGGTGFAAQTAPEIGCAYDPNTHVGGANVPSGQKDCAYLASNQTQTCQNVCGNLTPNGCDCFGCCEDPNRQGSFVYAGSVNGSGTPTCTSNKTTLADPTLCKPCTPVLVDSGCYKECGHCELCFGKTTLPADCYASPPDMAGQPPVDMAGQPSTDMAVKPPQTCGAGQQACGLPGQAVCPPGEYCITGCCTVIIL